MVSSDLGSIDLQDTDTGHTNGPWGHDVLNDWMDIATRPASTQDITHSVAGGLTINVNQGHIINVEVQANITGLTVNNLVEGHPILLILKGDGVGTYTANMSSIWINPTTTLNSSLQVLNNDVHHIMFSKGPSIIGSKLWAPAGVVTWAVTASSPGIQLQSTNQYLYNGSFNTTHTIPLPSGIQSGDFLQIIVATQENADFTIPNTPSGWTQHSTYHNGVGFIPRVTTFYKIATGGEGSSVNVTWATSIRVHGVSHRWSGVNATTPYDIADSAPQYGYLYADVDIPSITPVTDGAVVLTIFAANLTGGLSNSLPSGYSIVDDTTSSDRFFKNGQKEIPTATAENPGLYSGTDFDNGTAFAMTLRPA